MKVVVLQNRLKNWCLSILVRRLCWFGVFILLSFSGSCIKFQFLFEKNLKRFEKKIKKNTKRFEFSCEMLITKRNKCSLTT